MRTIKFRGKSVDYGTWRYGSLIIHEDGSMAITGGANEFSSQLWSSQVHPKSVGQWTGMVDKNGVEIYEGDVVESCSELVRMYDAKPTGEIVTSRSEIVWNDFSWAKKEIYDSRWTRSWSNYGNVYNLVVNTLSTYYEIVGNVVDNPELMEVE